MVPHIARCFLREVSTPPKWCDTPPLVLNFTQTHPWDTPFCNVSRAIVVPPHKNKHERVLRDTIATSIARYEKYRCWASKEGSHFRGSAGVAFWVVFLALFLTEKRDDQGMSENCGRRRSRIAKALAICTMEKPPNPENRRKIGQK